MQYLWRRRQSEFQAGEANGLAFLGSPYRITEDCMVNFLHLCSFIVPQVSCPRLVLKASEIMQLVKV